MYANYINPIRKQLFIDDEYTEWVGEFGLNYSLIEALWTDVEELGNIDVFCKKFADYYWNLTSIKEKARRFASIECVGSSRLNRYGNEQTQEIAEATAFLRYNVGLFFKIELPTCDSIGCRYNKKEKHLCFQGSAESWGNRRDHVNNANYASFKALLYIVRQIRNNLFHGNKFDLEEKQRTRNILLVRTAAETIQVVLDHLEKAEFSLVNNS